MLSVHRTTYRTEPSHRRWQAPSERKSAWRNEGTRSGKGTSSRPCAVAKAALDADGAAVAPSARIHCHGQRAVIRLRCPGRHPLSTGYRDPAATKADAGGGSQSRGHCVSHPLRLPHSIPDRPTSIMALVDFFCPTKSHAQGRRAPFCYQRQIQHVAMKLRVAVFVVPAGCRREGVLWKRQFFLYFWCAPGPGINSAGPHTGYTAGRARSVVDERAQRGAVACDAAPTTTAPKPLLGGLFLGAGCAVVISYEAGMERCRPVLQVRLSS